MNNDVIKIELYKTKDGSIDTTVKNINDVELERHRHVDLYLLLSLIIRVVTIFFHRKDGE
jgi:hypothetical protein